MPGPEDQTTVTDTPISTETETQTNDAAAQPAADQQQGVASDDEGTVLGGKAVEGQTEGDDDPKADPAATGAPEEYELALKDEEGKDVPLDPDMLGEAKELFKAANLSNEQANQLLPLAPKIMAKVSEQTIQQVLDAGAQQRKDWFEQFKADPDIGGSNREQTETLAAKALDALGFTEGHEFRTLLNETGFGNNVHMIRVFKTLGEAVAEDGTFATPSSVGNAEQVGWSDRYK